MFLYFEACSFTKMIFPSEIFPGELIDFLEVLFLRKLLKNWFYIVTI